MAQRIFTPDEATDLVPRLRMEFGRIALLRPEILALTERLGGAEAALEVLDGGEPPEGRAQDAERLRAISAQVHEAVARIHELGAVVKDVDLGLVDFHGQVGGKTVFLCWQYGEDRVEHFHGLDEGFAARRPLEAAGRTLLN